MLHRLRVRAKLTLVATVPLVCLVAIVAVGSVARVRQVGTANELADEVRLSVVATNLVHELQRERGLSSGLVGGGYQVADRQRVDDQRAAVDAARRQLVEATTHFERVRVGPTLESAMTRLQGLDEHRGAVDGRSLDLAGTLGWYTETIEQFLGVSSVLGRSAADPGLLGQLTAYLALSRTKEATGLERGMMNGVFGVGAFTGDQYTTFLSLVATQTAERGVFDANATESQRRALDAALVGPDLTRAAQLEGLATSRPTGTLGVIPTEWWRVMTVKVDRYRDVEKLLADDVVTASDAEAARSRAELALFLAAGLGLIALSGIVVAVTARALSQPMRQLTARAYRTARDDLPLLISSLQDTGADGTVPELPPIEVGTADEVADLAEAFNSVQRSAVDLAVDQAILRRNVAEMFINLGRRNQALIGRQLAFIDGLERDEADPGQLDKLFRLDHMTTRMRRNAESLLVLAGAELPRRWTGAVPVLDVVRAALSEIEDFSRVDITDLGDTAVAGAVATDLTHLLAELLENATSFSPPSSRVEVHGAARTDGYLLAVVDHGIGMSEAQLADANTRIDELARFDRSPSKLLGLYVVGRLAARHGINVRLVESVTAGVTAKVLVPTAALVELPREAIDDGGARDAVALVGAVSRGPEPAPLGPVGLVPSPPPLQRRRRPAAASAGAGPSRSRDRAGAGAAPAPVALVPAAGAQPSAQASLAISTGGEHSLHALRKRVRGAQLPDTGSTRGGGERSRGGLRSAGDVGASLGAFQAAVDRGRRAAADPSQPSTSAPGTGSDLFPS